MSEARDYSTLFEIYGATITDKRFLLLLIAGCATFGCLQKLGESLQPYLVTSKRQNKITKYLLGTYFQSILHVILVAISSYTLLYKFTSRLDELESINTSHADYFYIDLYRICTVISISYFIILTPYELFGIDQPFMTRMVMAIHHILCICGQLLCVLTNPLCAYVSAMGLQCEFSTVFLNIRAFGLAINNKYIYFIGGIGTLIFYPLTRIIFFAYTISKTYELQDRIISHIGTQAFYLALGGEIFIMLMSTGYTFVLYSSARRMIILNAGKDKSTKRE